ncbi:DgyrCDS5427 [Dimorphilus gyrociliatus]|uniref:DgyrCDS5427 n=1 Tax=Dimorphilus gyrociliatus TaxID=2664684 RepID=A0A7I8VJV5_9ANNE|nr:DgyrCDS5427 [Dimorphilus gyrociliatus]
MCGPLMYAFLKGGVPPPKKPEKQTPQRKNIPWVEKYRPRSVNDIAYQDEVVAVLKSIVKNYDMPNLLFYGPPGTGKTSSILAMARQLYGAHYTSRILELNASDERGINVVREKVKLFARQTASSYLPDGNRCPPFKIVILDEADSMTNAAQAALRRTIESEAKTTRFCLICNYVSRIIEPLASRCAKFRFKSLSNDAMTDRLKSICKDENIKCSDEALETLRKVSEGDMRKSVTFLQSCARVCGEETIEKNTVLEVAGVIPDEVIKNFIDKCSKNSHFSLQTAVEKLEMNGYSASQLIYQLLDVILNNDNIDMKNKAKICEKIAEVDYRLIDGADEYLQLMDLGSVLLENLPNY